MRPTPAPTALLWAALPLACSVTACSGKGAADSGATADTSLEGDWRGPLRGYAPFEDDWETSPYCEGVGQGEIDAQGALSGTGYCTILWGPAEGATFAAAFTGTTGGLVSSIDLTLTFDTDERSWDPATLTGLAVPDEVSGDAESTYHPSTGDDLAGRLELVLAPQD